LCRFSTSAPVVVEVKQPAENRETNKIHKSPLNSVFVDARSNWHIGDFARNAASWPGLRGRGLGQDLLPQVIVF
jgi:hypothetical protein